MAEKSFAAEHGYFNDAVVLMLKVCTCKPSIFGVILGMRSNLTMQSAFCPASRAHYPAFVNNSIFVGGPVGPHWTVLQSFPTTNALEIAPGVFVNSMLSEAHHAVETGKARADDVMFLSGYAAWPISRLKQEVAEGQWSIAKASTEVLLRAGSVDERASMHEIVRAALI